MTPRIVSLLPSATEIVSALGFADALVGRSHECDWPEQVAGVPVCTAPKLDPRGSAEEIHQRVEALLAESLSVYRVDGPLLQALEPTHIVTQVQCEVCAVSLPDVEGALEGWMSRRPHVVTLAPMSLADVFDDIQRVADALDVPERGRRLAADMRSRMDAIAARARETSRFERVAGIEWLQPPMGAGNWMPEIVEMAGAVNLLGRAGEHSAWTSWEDVARVDPDVLAVFPCGFGLDRVRAEVRKLDGDAGWESLRAVREGRVLLCDGHRFFNRPGPRLVDSLEILVEALHPDDFLFGHEGNGWERFSLNADG